MSTDVNERANFFRTLLSMEQQANLAQVKRGLDVPRPTPTQEQIEEAQLAAESSLGDSHA